LVVDSHSILARWRIYFSQILNVRGVNDVRQAEIHTAELLVHEPSVSEIELAFDKLKSHKSPGIDQMPAELIKVGGGTISSEIHKLIISIWNKEELRVRERGREREREREKSGRSRSYSSTCL
jgi:hypothetical protein